MMAEAWRAEGGDDQVWILRRHAGSVVGRGGEILNGEVAAARVREWFPEAWGSEGAAAALASMCSALELVLPGASPSEATWLRACVEEALRDGRLVALRVTAHPLPGGVIGELSERAAPEPAKRSAPREEKTWIEVVLVEADDIARPIPFERYRIHLPDGNVREGRLDRSGVARVEGIAPGTCRISFPDLDERVWRRA